jgi:hypothetical protein
MAFALAGSRSTSAEVAARKLSCLSEKIGKEGNKLMTEQRVGRIVKIALFVFIAGIIVAAGFVPAVLHLWNWLMPAVFGLHAITYWQALGLMLLCWILFGGPRWWRGGGMYRRHGMRRRWEQMTPEQREKFRDAMRTGCGHAPQQAPPTKA